MTVSVAIPVFQHPAEVVVISALYVAQGEQVHPGSKLFDCLVDLSSANPHDCPPQTLYRVSTRDGGWIRALTVKPGQVVGAAEPLAILTADPEEDFGEAASRNARLAIAAILPESFW